MHLFFRPSPDEARAHMSAAGAWVGALDDMRREELMVMRVSSSGEGAEKDIYVADRIAGGCCACTVELVP